MNLSSLIMAPDLTNPENVEANRLGRITSQQLAANNSFIARLLSFASAFRSYSWSLVLAVILILFLSVLPIQESIKIILIAIIILIPLSWIGYLFMKGVQRLATVKRDMNEMNIRHEDGKLAYGKNSYVAQTLSGEELLLPRGWSGLTPGIHYRFYYLAGSRTVLSAETVRALTGSHSMDDLQAALAGANRFNLGDLAENRLGRSTSSQAKRLLPRLALGLFIMLPSLLFLVYIFYWLLFSSEADPTRNWMIGSFVLLGVGVFIVIGLLMTFRVVGDLTGKTVTAVEGVGQKVRRVSRSASSNSSSTVTYFYQVGDQLIRVPERAYSALIDGLKYRVYFSPRSKILMSIEPLEPPVSESEENQLWIPSQMP